MPRPYSASRSVGSFRIVGQTDQKRRERESLSRELENLLSPDNVALPLPTQVMNDFCYFENLSRAQSARSLVSTAPGPTSFFVFFKRSITVQNVVAIDRCGAISSVSTREVCVMPYASRILPQSSNSSVRIRIF